MQEEAKFIRRTIRFTIAGVLLIIFTSSIMSLTKPGQTASAMVGLSPFPTLVKTKEPGRTPTRTNTPSNTPTSTPFVCSSWNLANDFRIAPNQENPNRDSCNNPGVWSFMESASLARDPSSYTLLPIFTANGAQGGINMPGVNFWQGTYMDQWGSYPFLGYNGSTTVYYGMWLPNVPNLHPAPTRMAIVGWRSPLTGYVSVAGGLNDSDPVCGDGIQWYVERNSTNLASGSFLNGGSQTFFSGAGGAELNTVAVNTGDMLYLIVHPNGNISCDTTRVDLVISVTSPPTPTPTLTPTRTATSTATTPTPRISGSGPCWSSSSSWPSYSAVYKIDASIPASWINSIDEAANAWTNVIPSPFSFLNSPNTPNNNNSISLGYIEDYYVPAYTGLSYIGSDPNLHLVQAFTIFNDQRTFDIYTPPAASSFSVQALMTHEIGHWLSLDDIYGLSCSHVTMFAGISPGDFYEISLEAEDKNGINWLYP